MSIRNFNRRRRARFFSRPPDNRVGEEVLWEIDEHAWLFIEPNAARAGAGRITLAVAGLDALGARDRVPIRIGDIHVADAVRVRLDRFVLDAAAGRRERVTSIGRNRGFAIDD